MTKYYFYKATIAPESYDYYDHSAGVVGYVRKQKRKGFIIQGTSKELNDVLASRKLGSSIKKQGTGSGY